MSVSGSAKKLQSRLVAQDERFGDRAIFAPGLASTTLKVGDEDVTGGAGYPARYYNPIEAEKDIRMKQEYVYRLNSSGVPTKYLVTDKDLDVIKQKSAETDLLQLDSFIQQIYNLNDPTHVKHIKELWPGYFERREQEIDRQLELQKQIAKIRMFGIQNQDDLLLLYGVSTGEIKLEPMAPWTGFRTTESDKKRFERGFFNLHRLFVGASEIKEDSRYGGQFRSKPFAPMVDGGAFDATKPLFDVSKLYGDKDYYLPLHRRQYTPSENGGHPMDWYGFHRVPLGGVGKRSTTPASTTGTDPRDLTVKAGLSLWKD